MCHLLDIQKIHGSLCYVAFVYTHGWSCLSSISNFTSKFKNDEFRTLYISSWSIISELCWWLDTLSSPSIICQLHPCGPLQDLGLYVDASTSWGIGIVIGDEWASFQLSPLWKIHGQDICWLKMIAIKLLIYFLEQKSLQNAHLLIHSNNQGTIGALGKGHSSSTHINLSVCHIYLVLTSSSPQILFTSSLEPIQLTLSHVENQGQLIGAPSQHLHSQRSSLTVLLMSTLEWQFPSATHVIERPVVGVNFWIVFYCTPQLLKVHSILSFAPLPQDLMHPQGLLDLLACPLKETLHNPSGKTSFHKFSKFSKFSESQACIKMALRIFQILQNFSEFGNIEYMLIHQIPSLLVYFLQADSHWMQWMII